MVSEWAPAAPSILPVREEHLSGCVQLIRKSFLTVAEDFGFTPENASRFTAFAITQERLAQELTGPDCLLFACWYNGQLAGYYSIHFQNHAVCEINHLCVEPSLRHNGLGRRLLEHAFVQARKLSCKKMVFGLVEENLVLKRWYQSFGFISTGTKKFDFFPFTCGYMEKIL